MCDTDAWNVAALGLPALRARVLRNEVEWALHRVGRAAVERAHRLGS